MDGKQWNRRGGRSLVFPPFRSVLLVLAYLLPVAGQRLDRGEHQRLRSPRMPVPHRCRASVPGAAMVEHQALARISHQGGRHGIRIHGKGR